MNPAFSPAQFAPSFPGNALVSDMSARDFSETMGPVTSNGLAISFFYDRIRIEDPLNPAENGTYKTVLCCRKRIIGDRQTESVRMITEAQAQAMYPREYAWFKQSQDVPTGGTPLNELPGISQSQISILVLHNVRSIEDLVSLSDDQASQIGMDARTAHAIAKRWWATRESASSVIDAALHDATAAAENERLRAANASMEESMRMMQAKLDVLERLTVGSGAASAQIVSGSIGGGSAPAQLMDADTGPDFGGESQMFAGTQMVTGNDDLVDDEPPVQLPGLDKRKR